MCSGMLDQQVFGLQSCSTPAEVVVLIPAEVCAVDLQEDGGFEKQ